MMQANSWINPSFVQHVIVEHLLTIKYALSFYNIIFYWISVIKH